MSRAMPSEPITFPAASRNGLLVTDRTERRSPKRPAISYPAEVSLSRTAWSRAATSAATSGSSSAFVRPMISSPGRPMSCAVALLMMR